MEKILDSYKQNEIDVLANNHTDNIYSETELDSLSSNHSTPTLKPVELELSEMNMKPLVDEPMVVKQSERENSDGSMKPVTDYAGSKGPKWVAMYQPPYKQLYSRSAKKIKHKAPVQK